jgi:small subunit ribosomal protein S1
VEQRAFDPDVDAPELRDFLSRLRFGEILSGTVAAVERFGVFVALDDGPAHPLFPGVGFLTIPELSWRHLDDVSEVVRVGDRVRCAFIGHDTYNGEARLSLRALQPDPLVAFADRCPAGTALRGPVTRVLPFGVLVALADGLAGLLHRDGFTPADHALQVGDELSVVVAEIDRARRRISLARP